MTPLTNQMMFFLLFYRWPCSGLEEGSVLERLWQEWPSSTSLSEWSGGSRLRPFLEIHSRSEELMASPLRRPLSNLCSGRDRLLGYLGPRWERTIDPRKPKHSAKTNWSLIKFDLNWLNAFIGWSINPCSNLSLSTYATWPGRCMIIPITPDNLYTFATYW